MAQSPQGKTTHSPTPFAVDPADELPVGVQLGWRLRALIVSGRLGAGSRMPSVRALAGWAGVNVNTVRGVYSNLEREGLILTRQGAGSFVSPTAGGSTEVERIAAEAIEAAQAAGIDPREVALVAFVSAGLPDALETALPESGDDPDEYEEISLEELASELDIDNGWLEIDETGARRELRRQIGRLEAQLATYTRDLAEVEDPTARFTPPEPRIATAEELERTRDALLSRLAAVRGVAARRARRERRAREARDEIVADPSGHRWEVVSAADAGEPGCTTWSAEPRFGPLGALMNWWRVKVSGGCPLPVPLAAAGRSPDDRGGGR